MRKLVGALIVLWGVSTLTFLLLHLIPGDPVDVLLGDNASVSDRATVRAQLGLDQSISNQYISFWSRLIHADLGTSFVSHKSVVAEIIQRLPASFALGVSAIFFAVIVGLPLGLLAAFFRGRFIDRAIEGFSLVGLSTPSFVLAPPLIYFFSVKLDILPVGGASSFDAIILPTASLGLALSAVLIRMTRASSINILHKDYVAVARAKGLGEIVVMAKHVFKNALTPVITVLSLQFGAVLTGVVLTETIFDWPGFGILFYSALRSRDYPMVQGCVLTVAIIYMIVNVLTDFSYRLVDPKLRTVRVA